MTTGLPAASSSVHWLAASVTDAELAAAGRARHEEKYAAPAPAAVIAARASDRLSLRDTSEINCPSV